MSDSIFTKIIRGEIPAQKIYEDDKTLAFLDIHPKTDGHVLVVPKKQIKFVWDLPDEDYLALMKTVKKTAARIKEILHPKYVGSHIVGIDVPHAHVHVFPFNSLEEYHQPQDKTKEPEDAKLAEIAKKLAF